MIGDEDPERKIIKQARAGGSADLVTMFLCFPLYANGGVVVGGRLCRDYHRRRRLRSHLSWNKIWISLVNGGTAGACIGICCGLLSIIYRLFHTGPLHVSVDHAMDAVQSPLYWLGLAAVRRRCLRHDLDIPGIADMGVADILKPLSRPLSGAPS